jgi:hypothetical protein
MARKKNYITSCMMQYIPRHQIRVMILALAEKKGSQKIIPAKLIRKFLLAKTGLVQANPTTTSPAHLNKQVASCSPHQVKQASNHPLRFNVLAEQQLGFPGSSPAIRGRRPRRWLLAALRRNLPRSAKPEGTGLGHAVRGRLH